MVMYYYAIDRWVKPIIERNAEGYAIGYAEGYAEGRAQGVAEADREWVAWLARKEGAKSLGIPFDEPPPSARC